MRILDSDMTIMIPVDSAQHAGLRGIIDSQDVMKVYDILKDVNWSTTIRRGTGAIKSIWSGSRAVRSIEIAMVLRELYNLRQWKDLSFGERKMFETARNLIKKELSIALSKDEEEIVTDIENIFATER